jgi:hypothetical protein
MEGFWIGVPVGVIVGILANQVFTMLTKLLPATLTRYPIEILEIRTDKDLVGSTITAKIGIGPPSKSRIFSDPLIEDLAIKLKYDNSEWVDSVWMTGESGGDIYFTANRTTITFAVLVQINSDGTCVYIANRYLEREYTITGDGKHKLIMQVIRVRDEKLASEKEFLLTITNSKFVSLQ